jgi:hypothetical protein
MVAVNAAPRSAPPATRNPEDLAVPRALRWFRERWTLQQAVRAAPSPRKPRRQKLPTIRRGWLSGWWTARLAAASGVRVEEFLRHRLSRYLAALPVSPRRLPVDISVDENGAIVSAPRPRGGEAPSWLERYLRSEGPPALQMDVQLAQAEVARLSAARDEQQARVLAAARNAQSAATQPAVFEADGGAEMLGRPPVPPPWAALIHTFALALLLAEAWQLAIPVLEGAGIDTSALVPELQRNPAGVVLGFVFAIGAAVSLFFFADLAIRRTAELLDGMSQPARRAWTGLAAVASLAFAAAVSWSISGLRPVAQHVDVESARFTLFLLALALPVTTSCMLRLARRLQASRDEALRRAVEWDQAHYRVLSSWTQTATALASAERELGKIEAARIEAVRRLRALQQRSVLAERLGAEAAAEEELELEQLCHAVTSSLELDRYEFLRLTGRRNAAAKSRPQREPREDGRSLGLAG